MNHAERTDDFDGLDFLPLLDSDTCSNCGQPGVVKRSDSYQIATGCRNCNACTLRLNNGPGFSLDSKLPAKEQREA
jgi:hypothetical protein